MAKQPSRMRQAPALKYTQSPNVFYDEWLPEITSLAELKVVELSFRYTFGYHVKEVLLSLTDIVSLSGLSMPSVTEGIKRATEHGYIYRVRRGSTYGYRISIEDEDEATLEAQITALKVNKSGPHVRMMLDSATKDSLVADKSLTTKDSLGLTTKDSLELNTKNTKESLVPYKDKENLKRNRKKTHTKQAGKKQPAVCVGSRFSLTECRAYAEHLKSDGISNPGGYATTIFRSGEADESIAAFLSQSNNGHHKQPTVLLSPPDPHCAECGGSGEVPHGEGKRDCFCRLPVTSTAKAV